MAGGVRAKNSEPCSREPSISRHIRRRERGFERAIEGPRHMKGDGYERGSMEETEMVCMSSSNAGWSIPGVSQPVRDVASPERRRLGTGSNRVRAGRGRAYGLCGDASCTTLHPTGNDDDVSVEVTIDDGEPLLKEPASARDDSAASPHRRPDLWRLEVAFALALLFMVVEAVGGLMADSLAVISDVFHLALDVASYGLALLALRYSQTPGTSTHTFGHARADVLGALGSIACLWMLNLGLLAEAASRLVEVASLYADAAGDGEKAGDVETQSPNGKITAVVATVGIAVNLALVSVLAGRDFGTHDLCGHGHSHAGDAPCGHATTRDGSDVPRRFGSVQNGSLSAAHAHAFVDLLQCAGVLLVGLLAWASPALGALADPFATCVFVVVAFRATWPIAKRAARTLMETAPEGTDVDALRKALEGLRSSATNGGGGGLVVRDLHVWSVSMPGGGDAVGSVRATVRGRLDAEEHRRLVRGAEAAFAAFGVSHATVQVEGDACVDGGDVACGGKGDGPRDHRACMSHATRDAAFSRCLKFD